MSSSRSARSSKKSEVTTRVKLLAKEINGTDDDTEEDHIEINSEESNDEDSSATDKPKKRNESSINRSAFSMPEDIKKLLERVTCCSCGKQLNPMNHGAVRKHPWLKVVTCKKCYKFLRSGPFTRDDDGIDEQCRWCGDGGRLYGCDYCHNCFCRHCIKRNIGRSEAAMMEDDDGSKWHCYLCKPKKIRKLRDDCEKILGYIETEEKKEKEKEERAKQREKEKLEKSRDKSKEKSKKEEKDKTVEKDKDKKEEKGTPKRAFPAPKGKSQIAEELSKEKKEVSSGKAIPVSQSAPDLIVVGDGPSQPDKLHHRAVNYRPDSRTGVQHVQKISSNVTAVTVGPKNDKPVVVPFVSTKGGGMPRQPVQKPVLMGMLTTNTGPSKVLSSIDRMIVKKLAPLNDISALKNSIFPYNVEDVAEKMSTMAQSLSLTLNSIKTDIAIAKLSQSNMFQAKQLATNQMKSGMEFFFNNIRELLHVQITAQTGDKSSEDKSHGDAKPLSSSLLTSTPIRKQEALVNSITEKLNESVIPIEIDASPVKKAEKKTEDMEIDEDVVIVTDSDTQDVKVLHVKNDKVVKEEAMNGELVKSESESKEETITVSDDTDEKNEKKATNDKESDESKDTNEEKSSEKEMEQHENAEQIEIEASCDSKADNKSDNAESIESKVDVSENTAAELELLKEMADELNDQEEKSKESDQPRRSSRKRNPEQSDTKNDSDRDSPVRRSSRQRQKPEDDSMESKDKTDKSSLEKGKIDSKKAGKTKEDSDIKLKDDASLKKEKSDKKSREKSKITYESEDENDEGEPDKKERKKDKGKQKKKAQNEDSDDNTEEEEPENKSKTKSTEKESKKTKKQTESEDKEPLDQDSDENTEEEVPESIRNAKSKKRSSDKKKSESRDKENLDEESDENTEDVPESKSNAKSKKRSSEKKKKQTSEDKSKSFESEEELPEIKKKSGGDKKSSDKSKKVRSNIDDMALEDQVPTDMSDTTESSDESVQEFGKRKKKKKIVAKEESSKRRTRQSEKKSEENTENSDSDPNFDSDLEKEIKSLSKSTKLTRKKGKESADSKKEGKGGKEKSKDKGRNAAKDDISDLSSMDEEASESKSAKRRTRQTEKKSEDNTENSDSDPEFDSDLEKEIESLSKDTRVSRSKAKESKESKKEESKSKKGKTKDKEDKKKRKVPDDDVSDLSSGIEEVPEEDEDSDGDTDNDISASQLKKLKQAGKAVLEEESDDDDRPDDLSSDSSDDPEVSFPKLSTPKKGKKKGKGKLEEEEFSEDSDFVTPKKKRKRATVRDKLLDVDISDSESETGKKGKGKKGKRKRKKEEDSDAFSEISDEEENRKSGKKRRRIKKIASSDEERNQEDGSDMEDDGTPGRSHKRRHIRKVIGSKKLTDETKAAQKAEEQRRKRIEERQKEYNTYVEVEGGESEEEVPEGTEREIHTPVKTDSIAHILGSPRKVPVTTKCVLEMDKEKKKILVEVDKTLVRKLKPHQVEAVRFMYNCCVESIERLKKKEGSGCILAHCMGLGKTLSVITFVHTMLSNVKLTKMTKCLVVCPLNTCLNWVNEFEIWLDDVDFEIEVYEMSKVKQNFERAQMLKEWHEGGAGVMILGYDMYRNLVNGSHCKNKKQKKVFYETLAEPGPDIIVCDEGHILKNDATSLSKAITKIGTRKRIVLTGTPLQNNLGEYHCMVDFVKPSLLGTRKEFNNRFCNPITNGQCRDSTPFDVKLMKRRAHILHELLAGCVQRKDYSALTKFLPPKFEYVISVRLAKVQMTLYEKYLEMNGTGTGAAPGETRSKGTRLFADYQALMRIWTHPWVLKLDEIRQENKRPFDDEDDDSFINDSGSDEDSFVDDSTTSSSNSSDENNGSNSDRKKKKKRKTRGNKGSSSSDEDSKKENGDEVVKKWTSKRRGNEEGAGSSWMEYMGYSTEQKGVTSEWWAEFVKEEDEFRLELSGKMTLMFEILKMCEDIGDKVLVFSQSLLSLDIIEDFLAKVDEVNNPTNEPSEADKDKPSTSEASGSAEPTENGTEKSQEDKNKEKLSQYGKSWSKGLDYFRMDGSTSSQNRKSSQDMFNDPDNYRARLFLISTKAGSLGINLVSANRVIIFDASWNPSHDIQSIFRVYRFGQVKPVYVYRFLAQGTMEEKIYERQVTKQSLSQRVVDEHQIERHFTAADLQELYKFQPDRLDDPEQKSRPLPMLPKDHMLAELMTNNKEWIVTYHEHDSLLENVVEQELSEEEKKAAWEDYEDEKKGISKAMGGFQMNPAMLATQQMNMQNLLLQGQANLGQAAVLQIVQDLKARFPNLPPEVFQQRVQAVLRQVLAQQIMQQSELQRRQIDQQRMNELNRLNQIKQQIQRQQAMISNQQRGYAPAMPQLQSMLPQGLRPQTMSQLQMRPNTTNFNQQKK